MLGLFKNRRSRSVSITAVVEALELRQMLAANLPGDYVQVAQFQVDSFSNRAQTPLVTNFLLQNGTAYYVIARGTHRLAWDNRRADAQTYMTSTDPNSWNQTAGPHLHVTGVSTWGAYQSDHEYGRAVIGNGSMLTAWISDSNYEDNAGALALEVYAAKPKFSVTQIDPQAEERDEKEASFAISRTAGSSQAVATVYYSVSPSATSVHGTSINDLRIASGSVVFGPGEMSKVIGVKPVDDDEIEPTEGFTVTLDSSRPGYAVDQSAGAAEGTVQDNDVNVAISGSPVTVGFSETYCVTTTNYDGSTVSGVSVNLVGFDGDMIAPDRMQVTTGADGTADLQIEGLSARTDGTDLNAAEIDLQADSGAVQQQNLQVGNPRFSANFPLGALTVVGGDVGWGTRIVDAVGAAIANAAVAVSIPANNGFATLAKADQQTNGNGFLYAWFDGVQVTNGNNNPLITVTINGAAVAGKRDVAVEHATVTQGVDRIVAGNNKILTAHVKNSRLDPVANFAVTLTSNNAAFIFANPVNATARSDANGDLSWIGDAQINQGPASITFTADGDNAVNNANSAWKVLIDPA